MKQVMAVLFALMPFSGSSQPVKDAGGKALHWTKVVQLTDSSVSKDDVYSRVLAWVGAAYKSGKTVTQVQDKEAGTIILKAATRYAYKAGMGVMLDGWLDYTVKLGAKDGRARIEVGPFYFRDNPNFSSTVAVTDSAETSYDGIGDMLIERAWSAAQKATREEWLLLMSSFIQSVNTKAGEW